MTIMGLILAYNEADCIEYAVRALRQYCDVTYVLDHGSTDETGAIADREGADVLRVSREAIPIKHPDGRQSFALWHYAAEFILARADSFDWVVWSDADEILRQPDGALPTKEAFAQERHRGVQVIRPLIRRFWMTTADGPEGTPYLQRMRYYRENRQGHQPRAWEPRLTPRDLPAGAHVQEYTDGPLHYPHYAMWPKGVLVNNNTWLLDHYPLRSREQVQRKIAERDWIMPIGGKRRYHRQRCGGGIVIGPGGMSHETRELEMP